MRLVRLLKGDTDSVIGMAQELHRADAVITDGQQIMGQSLRASVHSAILRRRSGFVVQQVLKERVDIGARLGTFHKAKLAR